MPFVERTEENWLQKFSCKCQVVPTTTLSHPFSCLLLSNIVVLYIYYITCHGYFMFMFIIMCFWFIYWLRLSAFVHTFDHPFVVVFLLMLIVSSFRQAAVVGILIVLCTFCALAGCADVCCLILQHYKMKFMY